MIKNIEVKFSDNGGGVVEFYHQEKKSKSSVYDYNEGRKTYIFIDKESFIKLLNELDLKYEMFKNKKDE